MNVFVAGPGKGMIVCGTRRICADLYEKIIALRPEWHDDADDAGRIKVVYSGDASDEMPIRRHVRRESQKKVIEQRIKDPADKLELVIVNDMLLTGFDAPPLHTMYMDRPMRGAALMQALARVNRRFRSKQDGLLVGYAPLTENLYKALAEYTVTDQKEKPVGRNIEALASELRDLHGVLCGILHGYPWRRTLSDGQRGAYRRAVFGVINYLYDPATPGNQVDDGELNLAQRFRRAASQLERLWAVCSTSSTLAEHKNDIAFFKDVRVCMTKLSAEDRRARGLPVAADVELYLRQLTAGIIESDGVTDIYAEAGIERPDLSHLDDAFLERMRQHPHPTLAINALRNAIEQQMRRTIRHNIVRQEAFSERLEMLMNQYFNENLSSAQVIAELVAMAREASAEENRGKQFSPPLTGDELAFYDAVSENESAVQEMAVGVLADIARDLVTSVRRSVTVDWASRDDVRAKLRSTIKRLLARHGYPPDAQQEAIDKVLKQMEHFAEDWSPSSTRRTV